MSTKRSKRSSASSGKLKRARFGGKTTTVTTTRRRTAATAAPNARLMKQVRALVAAKNRDAADVTRNVGFAAANFSHTISCLTSTDSFTTASSTTGLCDTDADEVLINSVRLIGALRNLNKATAAPTNKIGGFIRKILVWYKKPLLVSSSAGTLPPITEVLINPSIHSLTYNKASNGGRFKVLSDRKWNMGLNLHYYVAGPPPVFGDLQSGNNHQLYDYTVSVKRMQKYVKPCASGPGAGGHYDSDQEPGEVSEGLLILYTCCEQSADSYIDDNSYTRLNYTG